MATKGPQDSLTKRANMQQPQWYQPGAAYTPIQRRRPSLGRSLTSLGTVLLGCAGFWSALAFIVVLLTYLAN